MRAKVLIVLFLLALVVRVAALRITPLKLWDETVYANLGWDLKSNPFNYSFAGKWSDYVPGDWPRAGYRAPLLPYSLSLFYAFFNSQILVDFFMPFIGSLSVVLIYLLAEALFNKRVALYSSLFLAFLPLHVVYSSKIMTEAYATFFLLISALFFWLGFEKGKNKYKLFFGLSIGLSLLARYTSLFVLPIFPAYLILKYKNFSFLKDRFLWYSLAIFFLTLTPWLLYGIFEYKNPIGPFLHAGRAAGYWGGEQLWYFFFQEWLQIFSVLSVVFVLSLLFIFKKNWLSNKRVMFLLLWFFVFLMFSTLMAHKEERFLLPIVPPLAILSAFFVDEVKKSKLIFVLVLFLIAAHLTIVLHDSFYSSRTQTNYCFLGANLFLSGLENDSIIITEHSPVVYFYTKKETHFYPEPFNISTLMNLINSYYKNRPVYVLLSDYNRLKVVEGDLNSSFESVYRCDNKSVVYKLKSI